MHLAQLPRRSVLENPIGIETTRTNPTGKEEMSRSVLENPIGIETRDLQSTRGDIDVAAY